MEAIDIKKIKGLEYEYRRLKQIFADLSLECHALKNALEKSFKASDKTWACQLSDLTVCDEHTSGTQDIITNPPQIYPHMIVDFNRRR